ncbi:TPA: hypothetical protein KEU23_000992 [Klebsiella oxytoca]|nr:hypothetical protein [Klebsiella oxytoca]
MIKTVKQACRFNPVIKDYRMSQGIENLADLINDAGDGKEFFSRNYVTHGMEQLFREGMLRLSGKSDQAVFELTQAMGGGENSHDDCVRPACKTQTFTSRGLICGS